MSDPSVLVDAAKRMFIDPDDQERAREFAILFNQGLHLYPVGENKLPAGQWSKGEVNYVTTRADFTDMKRWLEGRDVAGWAILCGNHDLRVFTLDIEVDGLTAHPDVFAHALDQLPNSCKRDSVSGGKHAVIKIIDGEPLSTQPLARGPVTEGDKAGPLLAEIRGVGKRDDSAGAYAMVTGPGRGYLDDNFTPHEMTRAQVDGLLAPIRALHNPTQREQNIQEQKQADLDKPRTPRTIGAALDTGDIIANAVVHGPMSWLDVLEPGWSIVSNHAGRIGLLRPGNASSSETGNAVDFSLTIHSSNVDWAEAQESFTPPKVLAACHFGGNYNAAMKAAEQAATDMVDLGLAPAGVFATWPRQVLEDIAAARKASRDQWRQQQDEPLREWLGRIEDAGIVDATTGQTVKYVDTSQRGQRRITLTQVSTIRIKPVRWMWQDRMPSGTLTLVAGREGQGKSTVVAWLIAQVTRGTLPGDLFGSPRSVFVSATEDSWESTIAPRLTAAGADLSKVYVIDVITSYDTSGDLTLPTDVAAIKDLAAEHDAAMLVLDPLMSRLDGALDSHKDADTRRALEPLTALAEATGMVILGLMHFNKGAGSDPLNAVMASKAFTAVARSVHTVIRDPDDENLRKFATAKNNLGRDTLPLKEFTIESHCIPTPEGDVWTSKVVWGAESDESVRDAMERAFEGGSNRSAVMEAADWLADYMFAEGGIVNSADAKLAGKRAGHSEPTLKRAADRLRLVKKSQGFPRQTLWLTPEKAAEGGEVAPAVPVGSPVGSTQPQSEPTEPTEPTGQFGRPLGRLFTDLTTTTEPTAGAQLAQLAQLAQSAQTGENLSRLDAAMTIVGESQREAVASSGIKKSTQAAENAGQETALTTQKSLTLGIPRHGCGGEHCQVEGCPEREG